MRSACARWDSAVLKPSIKVLDEKGAEVPYEIAGPVKLGILGYQHNKPFNIAVNKWRGLLFPKDRPAAFEFPTGARSGFKFFVRRSPCSLRSACPPVEGAHLYHRVFAPFSNITALSYLSRLLSSVIGAAPALPLIRTRYAAWWQNRPYAAFLSPETE
jgi:hypothetical protein